MNRILAAIARMKDQIAKRLADGLTTQADLDKLYRMLDMDLLEFVKYQETKSLAFASGKLTLDEAQTLYNLLGETPDHFNAQPLEVKVVLTQAFGELLKWNMVA